MAGQRPTFKLFFKPKAKGTKAVAFASAWPNDFDGYNVTLEPGVTITSAEGEVVTTGKDGNYYVDIRQAFKPKDEDDTKF